MAQKNKQEISARTKTKSPNKKDMILQKREISFSSLVTIVTPN
jgi:hypothetical protein